MHTGGFNLISEGGYALMNATLTAQVLNFILMLCFVFLIIFVPILFIKLDRRTKNIEDLLIKLRKDLLKGN